MKIFLNPYLLPVLVGTLAVHWLILRKEAHRVLFLSIVSLAILTWLHPVFGAVAACLAAIATQLAILRQERRLSVRGAVLTTIALAVVVLGVGKYGRVFALSIFSEDDWLTRQLIMPLGISYFVFRFIQYIFDHCRGLTKEHSFFRALLFLIFTPTLPAGPIETYQGFFGKRSEQFSKTLFSDSLRRIPWGYFKKVVLADCCFNFLFGPSVAQVLESGFDPTNAHPLLPLGTVIVMFVWAYLDLSAYTDIAIGVSGLFGFRIMENFQRPFLKHNLGEFWRSWHISLSTWCRNNVYLATFGATRKPWLALYATMLTMGLWHYINLNWLTWALYHGTGLTVLFYWGVYKQKNRKLGKLFRQKYLKPLGYIITFLYVALGYSFVSTHDFRSALTVFLACLQGPINWLGLWLFG